MKMSHISEEGGIYIFITFSCQIVYISNFDK